MEINQLATSVNHAFFLPSFEDLRDLFGKMCTNPHEPLLKPLRIREEKASFLLEFRNKCVRMAQLLVHSSGLWTTVESKTISGTGDLFTTFECTSNLEQNSNYDFKAILKLENGREAVSNVLSIKTRKCK